MRKTGRAGFTLIELLVCLLIIGILAAMTIPSYYRYIERGKASEVVSAMNQFGATQERYRAKYGTYCIGAVAACALDTPIPTFRYFSTPAATAGSAASWTATATRNQTIGGYGAYVISYSVTNGGAPVVTCNNLSCEQDLMPQPLR